MDRKLLIAFCAGGIPFNGDTIKEASLGGSESALIHITRELAKLGHDVKVFNKCSNPGTYDGVTYFDYEDAWRDISPLAEWDVVVASRDYRFLAQKLHSRLNVLWNHDIATNRQLVMTNAWAIDLIFCLSQFHVDQWLSVIKELRPIMNRTRNGVDIEWINSIIGCDYTTIDQIRNKKIFLWGARPERGLEILIKKTWPKILKEIGEDCQLIVTGYDDSRIEIQDQLKLYYTQLQTLMTQTKNVKYIGPSNKEGWYRLLASSGFVIYPTQFPEISCLNALEAQVCGIPFITSNEFALRETVKDKNNLIDSHPSSEEYQNAFVARIKRLLSSSFEYKRSQRLGREHVLKYYEWKTIAKEWEDLFWNKFEERSMKNGGRNVLRRLVYNSDLIAAKWAIDNFDKTGVVLSECEKVNNEINYFLNKHHESPEHYNKEDDPIDKGNTWENITRFKIASRHIKKFFDERQQQFFSIVDVGCGAGGFLACMIKEFSSKISVFGIDFSEGLVERARDFIKRIAPDAGDPETFIIVDDFMRKDFQLPEETDCIFAGEWLEHQKDYLSALERLESNVKSGGLAVITIPNGPWEALSFKKHPEERFHVNHFEFRDIEDIFRNKKFNMEYCPSATSLIDGSLLGNWVVSWIVDHKPFGNINYLRKFKTSRPYQFVSCCMIVKNEEDNLSKCLKSIKEQIDEIIIVDTGSTDDTIRIAEKFANKVVKIEWPDDFSEARNVSMSEADSEADWIYWMDADEILINSHRLKKYLDTDLFNGYVITQNHLILDMPNVKPDVPVRIFKNHKGIKFFGSIHEHCEFAMDIPIDPILILPDVKIIHFGYYVEPLRRAKVQTRNLELLKKDRQKFPERLLGIVLMMRDYLNLAQWEIDETRGIVTDKIIKYLREVVRLHHKFFTDEKHLYHEMSFTLNQRALSALGRNGISVTEEGNDIPFEVRYALGGSFGGMSQDADKLKLEPVWFATKDELINFMSKRTMTLAEGLKIPKFT